MTYGTTTSDTVAEYERLAEHAEQSPLPVLIKVARVVVWILYAIVLFTAILLTLAFFLRLAGANPEAGFVEWVYRSASRAMEPFRGIFPTHELNGSSVVDTSLLFAALTYFVVALLADGLVRLLSSSLRTKEREVANARAQADAAQQQLDAQQRADALAVKQAAAREQAAQQAAAQQYAIARAAADDAVARATPPVVPTQRVAPQHESLGSLATPQAAESLDPAIYTVPVDSPPEI